METELGSLRLVAAGPERDLYRALLLLADESPEQVASYMNEGDLFVVEDKAGSADGLVLVLYNGDREAELKAVVVRPEQQGQGVAKRMLASVLARLRERGGPAGARGVHRFGVELWPVHHAFLPGHRVRVSITSSDFPWFARSLNRFGPLKDQAEPRVATNTVHHDAEHPSRIVLPIERGALLAAGPGSD